MKNRTLLLVLSGGLLAGTQALAVSTRTWQTATYKEFDEGEAEHALITSLGEVLPGQDTEQIDLEADAVWTAVRGSDGTVYTAGVSDGAIIAVSGKSKKQLASFEKETPWLGSLALGPDGKLYVGTLVTGSIYAVDTRTGKSERIVKLDGPEHIWALSFDGGKLYAGTGPNGKLFAVDVKAKSAKPVLDLEEEHILCIRRAHDGALWLGTSDDAILYRFDPRSQQARAIADFAGTEVRAVIEIDGAFVVAMNEFSSSGAASSTPSKGSKGTPGKTPEAGSKPGSEASAKPLPPRPGERKGKGALFRVEPDGRLEQLHALGDGYFTDLARGQDGSVYAAAGTNGRIYQVRPDRTVVTAYDVEERQVNALIVQKGYFGFVTGDAASLYVARGPAKDASYTSKVFDAQVVSRWGNIRWRGDEGILVETRSGNTSKPDRGWSGWARPAGAARAGGGAQVGRVSSPTGRYLQYRVTWKTPPRGAVREVTVYFLPQNQRARVTEVTIGEGGDAKKTAVTTQVGAAKPRSPVVKLKWKVENPDDDELVYTLEARQEGDADWRLVPTGEQPLTKTEFEWNTEALPDGYYRLRVTASDARVNPKELSLDDGYITPPFLVDNLKPQVTGLEVKYPYASARALDSFSRIDEIAYAVDGGEWVIAFPKDGIFDAVSEMFTVKLPDDLKPGPHNLQIRVADEADNIGAASVTFRVGPASSPSR